MPFTKLAQQASSALHCLSQNLATISAPPVLNLEFCTDVLIPAQRAPDSLDETFKSISAWEVKGSSYIYLLRAKVPSAGVAQIRAAFESAKHGRLGARAYARLNPQDPSPSNPVLYVGSSAAITSRIRQHLGYGVPSTFALHLAFWAQALELPLALTIARFPPSVGPTLIGPLEDTLWDDLNPLFGRKGRK
jgi:hypothetical protein